MEHFLRIRRTEKHVSDADLLHPVRHYARNTLGRDFVVGDIHGCFSKLDAALAALAFEPGRDRLFSVGDLIDRGPESRSVLDVVRRYGIRAVRGNHEQGILDWTVHADLDPQMVMAVRDDPARSIAERSYGDGPTSQLLYNGGQWFVELYCERPDEARDIVRYFGALPYAIQVETNHGLIGIVHAAVPDTHWPAAMSVLRTRRSSRLREIVLWDRGRWEGQHITAEVGGVCAVVVGHTPHRELRVRGNVINIDTGAFFRPYGNLTVLHLAEIPAMLAQKEAG